MSAAAIQRGPAWLWTAATSQRHRDFVTAQLFEREMARENARRSSHLLARALDHPEILSNIRPLISPHTSHYAISVSILPENQHANRYRDIVAYDRTRVVVPSLSDTQRSGCYLNASWVRERLGGKWWIATQAPLPATAHTFLSLLLAPISNPLDASLPPTRVRTVVQLTREMEGGRIKAHPYFPSVVGESTVVLPPSGCTSPPLKVTLLRQDTFDEAQCLQSTVSILPLPSPNTQADKSRAVTFKHLLYHAWPDHGVPEPADHAGLLAFLRLVDRVNKERTSDADPDPDPDPPIIVGCSAGVGRTGSFIALSSLLRGHNLLTTSTPSSAQLSAPLHSFATPPIGPLPDLLQTDLVAQEVDCLREQRPRMVERNEQVLLLYAILIAAFSEELS
jgi:protein tyrosine phosphatase